MDITKLIPMIVAARRCADEPGSVEGGRMLMGFCCQCLRERSFRHGKDRVADMSFLQEAGVFLHKVNRDDGRRLRGVLTKHEFRKFISSCLRSGKSAVPDKHVNESVRTMSEEQLELIRMWANEILTATGGGMGHAYFSSCNKSRRGSHPLLNS